MFIGDVERDVSRREFGRDEQPNPFHVDRPLVRLRGLVEAGANLTVPSEGDAHTDPLGVETTELERAAQDLQSARRHRDPHVTDATSSPGDKLRPVPDAEGSKPVLSQAAYDRLRTEYENLTTTGRKEVAARLLRARELGDLSENAEYHATKDEQGLMEARIRKLHWTLRNAQIVDAPATGDVAGPGMLVTVKEPGSTDDADVYLLAASAEERAKGARTVTTRSPFGAALVGKRPGDSVVYEAPGGNFTYEVVSVQPWDGS